MSTNILEIKYPSIIQNRRPIKLLAVNLLISKHKFSNVSCVQVYSQTFKKKNIASCMLNLGPRIEFLCQITLLHTPGSKYECNLFHEQRQLHCKYISEH